jgi:hypothetical protein
MQRKTIGSLELTGGGLGLASGRLASGRQATVLASVVLLGALMTGCPAQGIGDPCAPEAIPSGGFDDREIYVETSSVQCRTRTCMVFRLNGNPDCVISANPDRNTCDLARAECRRPDGSSACINGDELDPVPQTSGARVFCSCRCSAGGGDTNTPLCECTEGFHCVDVLNAGGVGVRGGYCVPTEFCTADADCPPRSGGGSPRCNLTSGVCEL